MNNCILMATVISSPELRYTPENQTPVTQMLVEFQNGKPEDPPATLKVVGWGNLATEIQESYNEGDRVILEGRLNMQMIERPEGFKEKRAELVAARIHRLDGGSVGSQVVRERVTVTASKEPQKVIQLESYKSTTKASVVEEEDDWPTSSAPAPALSEADLDEIPFMRPVYAKNSMQFVLLDPWETSNNAYWEGVGQFL